ASSGWGRRGAGGRGARGRRGRDGTGGASRGSRRLVRPRRDEFLLAWYQAAGVTEYVVVLRMTGRVDESSTAESSSFVLRSQVEGDVAGSVHVCRSDVFRFHASPYWDAQYSPR